MVLNFIFFFLSVSIVTVNNSLLKYIRSQCIVNIQEVEVVRICEILFTQT